MDRKKIFALCFIIFCGTFAGVASGEGTRHIKGKDVDLYFMNDKVFGTVERHPLWAVYNCGTDIKGEMDVNGKSYPLNFRYHNDHGDVVTGTFGRTKMALKKIEKSGTGFLYHLVIDDVSRVFSIRYERIENGHLVNSIIEGKAGPDKTVTLTVDGHLCPFATSGVLMIVAGALTGLSGTP